MSNLSFEIQGSSLDICQKSTCFLPSKQDKLRGASKYIYSIEEELLGHSFSNYEVSITTNRVNGFSPLEEFRYLIKEYAIEIVDEKLLEKFTSKIYQDELKVIVLIIKELKKNNHNFHIELYETDGDIESFYFVLHFPASMPFDDIKKKLLELYDFARRYHENKNLWFVGFSYKRRDV